MSNHNYSVDEIMKEILEKKKARQMGQNADMPLTPPEKPQETLQETPPVIEPDSTEDFKAKTLIMGEDFKKNLPSIYPAVSKEEIPQKEEEKAPALVSAPQPKASQLWEMQTDELERFAREGGLSEDKEIAWKQFTELSNQSRVQGKSKKVKAESSFQLNGEEPEDTEVEDAEETTSTVQSDDYGSYAETASVTAQLTGLRSLMNVRLGFMLIIFLGLAYISLVAEDASLPLYSLLGGAENRLSFLITAIVLQLATVLICASSVFGGLFSALRLKADSDSPSALAAFAVLGLTAAGLMIPESTFPLLVPLPSLGILMNILGKKLILSRTLKNFRVVSSGLEKHSVEVLESEEQSRAFVAGKASSDDAYVATSKKADFLTGFLSGSYAEDSSDRMAKVMVPMVVAAALVLSLIWLFMMNKPVESALIFTAVLVLCSPAAVFLVPNIPLYRLSRRLSRCGTVVTGFHSLEEFDSVSAVLAASNDLFPKGSVILHGIKTFSGQRIDDAIVDAASVVCIAGTTLSEVFSQVIEGKKEMLKEVDSIVYEDSMGVSAWVDSKRVLIGNRQLMKNHNIDVPSEDYENKYVVSGREPIYLANSGELTAMFIVSYNPTPDISRAVRSLAKNGVRIVIKTTDPNITAEKLSQLFEVDEQMFRIIPSNLYKPFEECTKPVQKASSAFAFTSGFSGLVQGLCGIFKVSGSIGLGNFLLVLSLLVGYGLVVVFAFVIGITQLRVQLALSFQLVLAFICILLPNLRKY